MGDYFKNKIALVFLVIFISMKMTGLHGLFHTDDKEHAIQCITCDFSQINNHNTPLLSSQTVEYDFKNIEPVIDTGIVTTYVVHYFENSIFNSLFSRPPPTTI